jgi:hypothetical protein
VALAESPHPADHLAAVHRDEGDGRRVGEERLVVLDGDAPEGADGLVEQVVVAGGQLLDPHAEIVVLTASTGCHTAGRVES